MFPSQVLGIPSALLSITVMNAHFAAFTIGTDMGGGRHCCIGSPPATSLVLERGQFLPRWDFSIASGRRGFHSIQVSLGSQVKRLAIRRR